MAINSPFSSSIQTVQDSTTFSHSMDFQCLAKTLNFNLPIKLDKTNHVNWKAQVTATIRAFELEEMISSSHQPPNQFIEELDDERVKILKPNPQYRAWKRAYQILLCWLLSTISARELAWTTLERLYAQQSMVRVLQLKQQLQNIKKGTLFISDFIMKIGTIGDALITAGHEVSDYDMILSILNGLDYHEYDPVVVLISSQAKTMNVQDVQYLLMLHEQRIEQLNTSSVIDVSSGVSANFVTHFDGGGRGYQGRGSRQQRGSNFRGGRGRCRGGRWNAQKLHCQLCQKPGHSALQCYKRFDQNWHGNTQFQNAQNTQHESVPANVSAKTVRTHSTGSPPTGSSHMVVDLSNANFVNPSNLHLQQLYISSQITLQNGSSSALIHKLISDLNSTFALKTLALRNSSGLLLTQTKYVTDLLNKTNMLSSKPCATPIGFGTKLSLHDSELFSDPFLYRSKTGSF
ncbi:hypothetical protein ACOSQ4_020741 [Xanthoceras sorbifolium]